MLASLQIDGVLSEVLAGLVPSYALGAARRIAQEDDELLTPVESACLSQAVAARRRASGAARMLARSLLRSVSAPRSDILWSLSGAPKWPAGIVGSLAHDKSVAVAVVGYEAVLGGLGVDVEPAQPLDEELIPIVVDPTERRLFGEDPLQAKVLFCIKEAVFKAVNPCDGRFLAFSDVTVDQASGRAQTSYGRIVRWRAVTWPRVMALAWWTKD